MKLKVHFRQKQQLEVQRERLFSQFHVKFYFGFNLEVGRWFHDLLALILSHHCLMDTGPMYDGE